MTGDLYWHVNVEVTPANASVFRVSNRSAAPLSRTVWVAGELSLRQGGGLHLVSSKDRRLGNQALVLRVPARLSASDGVATGSGRCFSREVLLWHHGTQVRVLMSKAGAREMLSAVTDRERY